MVQHKMILLVMSYDNCLFQFSLVRQIETEYRRKTTNRINLDIALDIM